MHTDVYINAGVIEGFFGQPWGWPARLDATDFLANCGYQFYIYAPKADPFLRRRWREPMPAETLHSLSELQSRCRHRDISLGVGLSPYEIYMNYDANAQSALRLKVLQINDVGAEILCVLFDDMRGDVDGLADLQARVIADVCTWSSAQRFIVCPTYYSYDECLRRQFGAASQTYLRDFSRRLDHRIEIFWTGEKVISESYPARHLLDVANEIGRRPFIWDNHISNDSRVRTSHLYLDPSTATWELPSDLVAGLAINPMNQPHLSRIALYGFRRLVAGLREPWLPWLEASFADRLLADRELLQDTGLEQLDPDSRRRLLDWYGSRQMNPYAEEIAAWLRGEYRFDPQCLTT